MRQWKSFLILVVLCAPAEFASASRIPDDAKYFPYSRHAGFVVIRETDKKIVCKGRNLNACPLEVRAELRQRSQSRVVKRVRGSRQDFALAPLAAAYIALATWDATISCWNGGRATAKLLYDKETMPWVSPKDHFLPAEQFLRGSGAGTSALYVLIRSAMPKFGRISAVSTGAVAGSLICGAFVAGGYWVYDGWIRELNDVQAPRGQP